MKVEVNKIDGKPRYPCLMINDSGLVVMFTSNEVGTALSQADGWFPGEYYDDWDMDVFEPFHGTITLSNE